MLGLLALAAFLLKLWSDARQFCSGRPAVALPQSARLEMLLLYIALFVGIGLLLHNALKTQPSPVDRWAYACTYAPMLMLLLYLMLPMGVHALAAATRHRSARMLSVLAARRIEAAAKIL